MKLGTVSVSTPVGPFERVVVAVQQGLVDATAARIALLERSCAPAVARRSVRPKCLPILPK